MLASTLEYEFDAHILRQQAFDTGGAGDDEAGRDHELTAMPSGGSPKTEFAGGYGDAGSHGAVRVDRLKIGETSTGHVRVIGGVQHPRRCQYKRWLLICPSKL